ncbi:hypothetical protein WS55_17575 [Burkholderia pseudomultivorans]|nr:hypothetical protein WS56_29735 [Burkholderia pseudomultivorans]KVC24888.1 hypothetical protein WS55_17575 [Burkholderia pseudomultivorans]
MLPRDAKRFVNQRARQVTSGVSEEDGRPIMSPVCTNDFLGSNQEFVPCCLKDFLCFLEGACVFSALGTLFGFYFND